MKDIEGINRDLQAILKLVDDANEEIRRGCPRRRKAAMAFKRRVEKRLADIVARL